MTSPRPSVGRPTSGWIRSCAESLRAAESSLWILFSASFQPQTVSAALGLEDKAPTGRGDPVLDPDGPITGDDEHAAQR